MKKLKKYVLSGGPGIGKTTVLEILASRGYKVVPEASRMIIEEEKTKESDNLPWKNLEQFQKLVAERQIELEEKIEKGTADGDTIFLDRSLIDGYGYSMLGKVNPPEIIEKIGMSRYEKIFILDPLPNYVNDDHRWEDASEGLRMHRAVIDAYKHFGYAPVFVPVMTPEERVKFILEN